MAKTHTAHIFWNQRDQMIVALPTEGRLLPEKHNICLGSHDFTMKDMPGPDWLRKWALQRMALLGIPHKAPTYSKKVRVRSYLKNAASWRSRR